MATRRSAAASFALRLVAWSLVLFGWLRLPWISTHIVLPVTRLQAAAGTALVGRSSLPVEATLACSGADALALCLAAVLAYPARCRMRAAGIVTGTAVLLTLNTVRIGTLGRVAAQPRWFDALHLYAWPTVLTVAVAGFVFTWMRVADGVGTSDSTGARWWGGANATDNGAARRHRLPNLPVTLRFVLVVVAALVVFTLLSPLYLTSAPALALAGVVTNAAGFLLRVLGTDAAATGSVLSGQGGAFLVTPECISTPLIPVYLGAVLVYSRRWSARALWMAAGLPLFIGLGIARLLVIAIPAGLDPSPAFSIHAFSQLLVGAGMVCGLAIWRYGSSTPSVARAAVALALAIAFVRLLGAPYTRGMLWLTSPAAPLADPQGALMFLPAFQVGLFLALWVAAFVPQGWTRFLCGAALLAATQVAVVDGVQLLSQAGIAPHVRDVRAWALLGPALIIAIVVNVAPSRD